jgi:V/A-type H+-transporting ATPase subunit I
VLASSVLSLIIKAGAFGITEITGFVGTWLSYARLLALLLATGGIALAINIMADKLATIPVIGIVLSIFILIAGHLFNFAINLLGSTIHSIRLHYVELFSQFYDASGKAFKRFTIKKEKKVL